MGTYRVTCHKPDDDDADRRIEGLGGPGGDRSSLRFPVWTLIRTLIEAHCMSQKCNTGTG